MSSETRTVILSTVDHGEVTLPEPDWCEGHDGHEPQHLADLTHASPDVILGPAGLPVGYAEIYQGPCAEVDSREVRASAQLDFETSAGGLSPTDLYDLAAAMDTAADQLRDLADRLTRIREGDQ
ncbi:DUF6907 domain-containing protein [Streptomyces bauhiniae]